MRVAATPFSLPKFAAFLLIVLLQSEPVVSAPVVLPDCVKDETATTFNCEIRLGTPAEIDTVFLKSASGSPEKALDFIPFTKEGQKAAWLLLIDQSDPARAKIIDKIVLQIRRHIIKTRRADQLLGIAGYAESFNILAPLGSSTEELHRGLDKLQPRGQKANLYTSAFEAIGLLVKSQADRKALVFFSDGTNAEPASNLDDLVSAAKAAGILIYGVGFTGDEARGADFQNLWRLAEQTGGLYRSADSKTQTLPDDFSELFYRHLESGGQVSFPIPASGEGESQVQLIVQFSDGSRALAEVPINTGSQAVHNAIVKFISDLERPFPLYIAAIFLTLIFLIAMVLRIAGKRNDDEEAPRSETREPRRSVLKATRKLDPPMQPIGANDRNPEPHDAWLEFFDPESTRLPLNQPVMHIGRHADNDIRLKNVTVHRRHAVLQRTPDGRFIVTNLSGKNGNGVLINNQLIEHAELRDGDVLELGEVRLRFRSHFIESSKFPNEFESERLSGTG